METSGATSLRRVAAALWWPAVAALALHLAFMVRYVARHGGDVSILAGVGGNQIGRPPYEAVRIPLGVHGYDGQFYYALARAPWRRHDEGIDSPAARHLRILYPALCWLLSGGDAEVLFWVMPAVNLTGIAALAALGAWLAVRQGLSPWWGFLLPLAVNVGLPSLRNLTDPLAVLALAALLAAWVVRARAWMVGLCAAAAVLAREQNAAIVGLLLVVALWQRRCGVATALAAALCVWAGWVGALRATYGEWPFLPGQGNFGGPLEGLLFRWGHLDYPTGTRRLGLLHLATMLHFLLQFGLAGYLFLRSWRRRDRGIPLVALAGVALALVAGIAIYEDFWSYTRVLVWLPLGVALAALQARKKWILVALVPAMMWTVVVTRIV